MDEAWQRYILTIELDKKAVMYFPLFNRYNTIKKKTNEEEVQDGKQQSIAGKEREK